jgi:probable HAF family extracellular repeat protein
MHAHSFWTMMRGVTASTALFLLTAQVYAQSYTITDLGALPGFDISIASDINNHGEIVGYSYRGPVSRGFIYVNGQMHDLGTLGGDYSDAQAINDAGQITGVTNLRPSGNGFAYLYTNGQMINLGTVPDGRSSAGFDLNEQGEVVGIVTAPPHSAIHASLFRNGAFQDLGTLGGFSSYAHGINDRGDIVGRSETPDLRTAPFLYRDGQMIELSPTGTRYGIAHAINNSGVIVGVSDFGRPILPHAFVYKDGQMIDLTPEPERDFRSSGATDINERGEIVGSYQVFVTGPDGVSRSEFHPFLYRDGRLIDILSLLPPGHGWQFAAPSAINDRGQILVNVQRDGFYHRGFLLTPVPEPGVVTLLLSALFMGTGVGIRWRRRRRSSS